MHDLVLKFTDFVLDLFNSALSFAKILVLSRPTGNTNSGNKKETAVILGNGPSLNTDLPELIRIREQVELVCVNMFSNSPLYEQLQPENYIMLDDAFADENHAGASLSVKNIVEKTQWPLKLYVPVRFRKKERFRNITNSNIRIYYFNYTIFEGFEGLKFWLFDRGIAMPQCQNVLNATVFLCVRKAYERIILLGADHTWHEDIRLNENNELRVYDTHFYETQAKDISGMFLYTAGSYLKNAFLNLHKVYRSYEIIARYAAYRKVLIINSSSKSYIDVFRKVKLENEFKG
ncbi:DUF115 domain-containing protein [Emticicia sp. CRIBPO]|uniref:6-hydroxymethylpterin diphosphokinase MptE-like protein n=1 Tax=Emticicia sp. CRIBPO TaxID=2683258 RepID=UPI001412E29E|nr:6-hydroxymethylpterin diphosphokinase MptE-like protein [Emticicia sp. CRIBPO]NBA88484.1 DUF115 domain-containing protein [Emticicia sp. CRIBPO]